VDFFLQRILHIFTTYPLHDTSLYARLWGPRTYSTTLIVSNSSCLVSHQRVSNISDCIAPCSTIDTVTNSFAYTGSTLANSGYLYWVILRGRELELNRCTHRKDTPRVQHAGQALQFFFAFLTLSAPR
jgi:hypothetical protein